MKDLPSNLKEHRRTPVFTESSVPDALLGSHSTKTGTWGKIVVLEGTLIYRILEPEFEELELDSDFPGVIEPTIHHKVEPRAAVRFYVQFYRQPET